MADTPERITRDSLRRQIVVNALTKPVNVATLSLLVVVGILFDLIAIALPIAVVAYLVLCAITFFDGDEAARIGERQYARLRGPRVELDPATLDPIVAPPIAEAQATAQAIREAIAAAEHPFADVSDDVDALLAAMETSARRAQLIATTLRDLGAAGQAPRELDERIHALSTGRRSGDADVLALIADLTAQRDSSLRLAEKLDRYDVSMQRICASLGLMRTRLVEMSASEEEAAQRELARQSRDLRERTDLLAESMAEVFASDGDEERLDLPGNGLQSG
jgi:hypothetical protein